VTRYRVTYAVFLLGCLIFSVAYQSRITSVLLIVAAAYPVVALVLTVISLFMLRIGFDEKRAVYEKCEQFELPVRISNNFLFPYAPAELDCIIPDSETGLFLRKQIYASVAPLKRMRIFVPCMHRYRGSYSAKIRKLSVYDPLRLIRISRKLDIEMQLVFMPRKITLDKLGLVFGGERGAEPEQRMMGEKENFSHVREYVQGDVVQLVHWKLTAKLDELMIKQYDSQDDRRSVILCNFGRYNATPSAVMRQSDAVTETAVAVAMSAVNAGIKAFADTGALSDITCDIADSGGFRRFFDIMSVLPHDVAVLDFPELVDKYSVGNAAVLFLITPVVSDAILEAAQRASERMKGAVVLIYANCTGKQESIPEAGERTFIFAEMSGETADSLPVAADRIIAEYSRLNN